MKGSFSQCQAQKHSKSNHLSLGFTVSGLLWFQGHRRERRKQQAQSSDAAPGEASLICFLLRVSPEMPLNAPATPSRAPSQLSTKPLHSQLLETARERLKVHVPWLCRTEIAGASTFGPWTAAKSCSRSFATFLPLIRGSSKTFQCLLRGRCLLRGAAHDPSAAAAIPFGRRLHDIQTAPVLFLPWAQLKSILQIPVAKLSCPLFRAPCFPEVIPRSCTLPWLSLASKQLSGCISPPVRAKDQSCHHAWSR